MTFRKTEIEKGTPERRILVVDDDQAIRNLLCAVLRRRGLEVDVAENGAEGLGMLADRSYGIILLDLMMPLVDGHLFLRRLQDLKIEPRPIVLVISASDESDFRKLERGSVSAIIRKPFDIFELAELVGACVETVEDRRPDPASAGSLLAPPVTPRIPITGEALPAPAPAEPGPKDSPPADSRTRPKKA